MPIYVADIYQDGFDCGLARGKDTTKPKADILSNEEAALAALRIAEDLVKAWEKEEIALKEKEQKEESLAIVKAKLTAYFPPDLAFKAFANVVKQADVYLSNYGVDLLKGSCKSAREIIRFGFAWDRTPEGKDFWQGVSAAIGE